MKTVLVVDDEFDLTGTLRAILEGEGYRVETCSNGAEALEWLGSAKSDLVLMDVMMPLGGGFEALRSLRQSAEYRELPVVMMSSVPPAVRREDYQWQAFLRKPFSLDALIKTVALNRASYGPYDATMLGASEDDAG